MPKYFHFMVLVNKIASGVAGGASYGVAPGEIHGVASSDAVSKHRKEDKRNNQRRLSERHLW